MDCSQSKLTNLIDFQLWDESLVSCWSDYVLCCIPFKVRCGIFLNNILKSLNKKHSLTPRQYINKINLFIRCFYRKQLAFKECILSVNAFHVNQTHNFSITRRAPPFESEELYRFNKIVTKLRRINNDTCKNSRYRNINVSYYLKTTSTLM